jgi:serine kinase
VKFEDKISSADLACKIVDRKKKTTDEKIVEMMKKICHPNIVVIHSMFQNGFLLFIFMQWMDEGNLLDHIRKNGAVEERKAKRWFHQMASAIHYLHSIRVSHCNLSCASVMIWKGESVKISGMSHLHFNSDKIMKTKSSNPIFYQAPEVHSSEPFDPFKADIFSLGVILFIMLNNAVPYTPSDVTQLIADQQNRRYRIRTSFMHKLSIDCQVAINVLLEPDPRARLSIEKILNLRWIN